MLTLVMFFANVSHKRMELIACTLNCTRLHSLHSWARNFLLQEMLLRGTFVVRMFSFPLCPNQRIADALISPYRIRHLSKIGLIGKVKYSHAHGTKHSSFTSGMKSFVFDRLIVFFDKWHLAAATTADAAAATRHTHFSCTKYFCCQ